MTKKEINLLIIEDNAIIANAYADIIHTIPNIDFSICIAKNCDKAVQQIKRKMFDLVLLDLQLPVSTNERYVCGEDLGLLIRKVNVKSKIIVLTNITDSLRIANIIKELDPEGFIIKTDIETNSLKKAIIDVLSKKTYNSKSIDAHTNKANRRYIDNFDRQILYHLSMGEKIKDIPNFVTLSKRTIEERLKKLKLMFNVSNNSNLIKAAKKAGFI